MSDKPDLFANRGALWGSKKDEDGDWTGKLNIDGVEYKIVAKMNPKFSSLDGPFNPKTPEILLYNVPVFED